MSDTAVLPRRTTAWRIALVIAVSFALGGATSFAQWLLPDEVRSIANSASGWTLATALLVWSARVPPAVSAVLGAASFVLLTLGYTVISGWRGYPYDPTLFAVVGVVVGPFVGVAARWLRERGLRAAVGTALLAGIGIGEGVYGLTVVAATTSPVYWVAIGLAGLALVALMLVRRIRGPLPIALTLVVTAAVAAAFVFAYQSLGSI